MQIEYSLIEHGAPTLAGLKTANLFPVRAEGEDVIRSLRRVNRILNRKGIRAIPLRKKSDSILLYLFRPERLEEDLNQPETVCMLKEMGYPCGRMDLCISCLVRHLKEDDSFPHEIGLFLGQRVELVGDRMPDTSDLPAYFDFPSRLPSVPAEGTARTFPVRYSMEDVNGHLNNAQYMALAQDAVEEEFGRPVVFDELEATFHSAVCAPDELKLYSAPEAEGRDRLVSGYKKDGTLSFCAALRGVKKITDGTNQ